MEGFEYQDKTYELCLRVVWKQCVKWILRKKWIKRKVSVASGIIREVKENPNKISSREGRTQASTRRCDVASSGRSQHRGATPNKSSLLFMSHKALHPGILGTTADAEEMRPAKMKRMPKTNLWGARYVRRWGGADVPERMTTGENTHCWWSPWKKAWQSEWGVSEKWGQTRRGTRKRLGDSQELCQQEGDSCYSEFRDGWIIRRLL